jgi:hypothetical protein
MPPVAPVNNTVEPEICMAGAYWRAVRSQPEILLEADMERPPSRCSWLDKTKGSGAG